MTIYSLDVLLFLLEPSVVSCSVLLIPDLHTRFSRSRSSGLVFPPLEEFCTVCGDPYKGFGIVNKADIDAFWNSLDFW